MKKLLCLLFGLFLTGSCFGAITHFLNLTMPGVEGDFASKNFTIPTQCTLKKIKFSFPYDIHETKKRCMSIIRIYLYDPNGKRVELLTDRVFAQSHMRDEAKRVATLYFDNRTINEDLQLQIVNEGCGSSDSYAGEFKETGTLIFTTP